MLKVELSNVIVNIEKYKAKLCGVHDNRSD